MHMCNLTVSAYRYLPLLLVCYPVDFNLTLILIFQWIQKLMNKEIKTNQSRGDFTGVCVCGVCVCVCVCFTPPGNCKIKLKVGIFLNKSYSR